MTKPVVVCGCHGGGTSFIAKMLRMSGLFLGSDAGAVTNRKFHESRAFRLANMSILEPMGDKNGMLNHTVLNALHNFSNPNAIDQIAKHIDVERLLLGYWSARTPSESWGWKDPRNSLTFPVWAWIFPGAKPIVISKMLDDNEARSRSGYWFRHVASDWIRMAYMRPRWAEGRAEILFVSFEKATVDYLYYADMLDYCGLHRVSRGEHNDIMKRAKFEYKDVY